MGVITNAWIAAKGGKDELRRRWNTEEGRAEISGQKNENPTMFDSNDFLTELTTPLAPENDPLMQMRAQVKAEKERRRLASGGRESTILTGGQGITAPPNLAKRKLLGGDVYMANY